MGKIEEGGANVGSMHPVTPVDQVLSKTMTAESVDAEFNALLLTNKNETPVDPEQVPELPADIPPAEDPMNPIPENPNERVATKEEIKSVSDLEAEMESFFGDNTKDSEMYTEKADNEMYDTWSNYIKSYKSNMRSVNSALNSKRYDECIKYANSAINDMTKCKEIIMNLHSDKSHIALNTIVSGLLGTLKFIAETTIGFFVINVTKTTNKLKGLRETIKKDGLSSDIFDSCRNELIGACETNIKAANNFIKKANKNKSKGYQESSDIQITGDEYLYLEEAMKDIDHLCKMSGITSPSTSVKEGEDAFIFEGYDDGSENYTSFFEEGDKTIDEDIRPIVEKLNSKGYKTIASCSGHPSARAKDDRYHDGVRYKKLYSTARIVFDKIYDFPNIPDGWTKKVMEEDQRVGIYVDPPRFKIIDGLPEKQYANWKRRYMRALEKWADELPKEGETKETDTSDVSLESVMEDVVTDAMVGV